MAWTALKNAIAAVIKTNGNQEITGAVLQSTLNTIVSNLGENATFKDVATPTTVPGTPDGTLFYIAYEKGIYVNFNAIEITDDDGLVILLYSENWHKINIPLATKDELVQVRSDLKLSKVNNEEIWGFKNLLTSVVAGKSTAFTSPNYYIATDVEGAISNYISCVSGEMFCIQGFLPKLGHYILFLDENKNVISGLPNAATFTQSAFPYCGYFTVPVDSSIKYFVLTLYRENNIETTTGNIQKPFDANTAVVAKITSISELPLKIKIKQNAQIINDSVASVKADTEYKNIKESVARHSELVQAYDSKTTGYIINASGTPIALSGYNYNTYAVEKSDLKDYYVSSICNGSAIYYVNYYNNSGIFIGSEYPITNGSSLTKAKLTIPSGAVTLKLNYQSGAFLYCDTKIYENLPEKINNKLNKDDTTYQKIVSSLTTIGALNYTSIVNTLVNSDGTDSTVWVNQSYWYAVYPVEKSDTKKYYLTLKYTTGSGFFAVNYYDVNGILLGHEYEVGTLDTAKAILTIPTGAVTMKVNYYTGLGLPIVYLDDSTIVEDVSGKLDAINDEIEAINSSSAFYKKMEITKNTNSIYIRSKYDDTRDLVIVYDIARNNNYFSPKASYLGLSTDTTINIVASNVVHYTYDSTPPISTSNYWFISGEHGYIVPKIVSTGHNKTSTDIGSWWKTEDNKNFQLVGIDGTSLILVPKITIDGGGIGKDVSDYSYGSTVLTSLTHVSGATNTSDIAVTTSGGVQLFSSTHNISKKFYCDGIEITTNGIYKCNEFSVTDVHEVINPTSITQYYPTIIASSVMARNVFTYKFTGLSCFISNTFEVVNRPIWLEYYGAMQPLGLSATGDFHSFIFIPKVKSATNGSITTDWKYPQDCTAPNQTWAKTTFNNSVEDLITVDDFPERIVQYYKNPTTNELLIGFAAGYSLLSSSTVNSKRKNLTSHAFTFAQDTRNKFYCRCIQGTKFADKLLPVGTVLNFNYYYTYFKPSEACQVYWYKEGNSWIVYAHSHAEQTCNIELPEFMESMIATIIEKTTETELLTDTVVSKKLIAKFPAGANYIVVKLS